MKQYAVVYLVTLLVMGVLDAVWLGGIARDFYKPRFTALFGDMFQFSAVPAILFYLLYNAGIVIFVNGNMESSWQSVALYGALLGFFGYMTYDLTNLATIKGWPLSLAAVDVAWGTFNTAASATAGWLAARYFLS